MKICSFCLFKVSFIPCVSDTSVGDFLSAQLIYPGKVDFCHPLNESRRCQPRKLKSAKNKLHVFRQIRENLTTRKYPIIRYCKNRFSHDVADINVAGRLLRCIRCPTAYHIGDFCIAAGSINLTGFNIVCARHFQPILTQKHHTHVNVSWCFDCNKGTSL